MGSVRDIEFETVDIYGLVTVYYFLKPNEGFEVEHEILRVRAWSIDGDFNVDIDDVGDMDFEDIAVSFYDDVVDEARNGYEMCMAEIRAEAIRLQERSR